MDKGLHINCKHRNKQLKVTSVSCTCETVLTICDDCKQVLNTEVDC